MNRIQNRAAAVAIALGIGAIGTGTANAQSTAQTTVPVQKPIRIKIGGFFPTESKIRDNVGNPFFTIGGSYDFGKRESRSPVIYSAYADFAFKSKDVSGNDGRVSYFGIGPAIRTYFTPPSNPYSFYGGAGLGLYFISAKAAVQDAKSENKAQLGGKLFGGAELANGFFGELDFTYINEILDTSGSGIGLSVGYRF